LGIGIRAPVPAVLPYRHVQEISRAFSAVPAKERFHAHQLMQPDKEHSDTTDTHTLPHPGKNSETAAYAI
jgi:hypothetical protein